MTGELKDAHTRVESPKRVAMRLRDETVTLGFSFMPVDGRLAVSTVSPDSDAWWSGVRPGMLLVAIHGEPALQAYEKLKADTRYDSTERSRHMRAMRRLITGEPTIEPRMVPVPVRLPLPPALRQGSIYENQSDTGRRYFPITDEPAPTPRT